jgi:hypothetical protein
MSKLYPLLLLLSTLASCTPQDTTQTIKVEGRYSIDLPSSFTKTAGLNNDASLQYQDISKELYIIVIDEPKSVMEEILTAHDLESDYTQDLEGYSQLIIDGMDPSITIDSISDFREGKINNLRSRELFMQGVTGGYRIYWKFAFVEGKNRYYQIMVWTLADNKAEHEGTLQNIISSFHEMDRSKKR